MGSKHVKRRILVAARPWLRANPKPPKARTMIGEAFSAANYRSALVLQQCNECDTVQYPPRELCRNCLGDDLTWRDMNTDGEILSCTYLNVSQWEFFKRKAQNGPWPIANVKLADQCLFAHLAVHTFKQLKKAGPADKLNPPLLKRGTKVKLFSQSDMGTKSVLIAVSPETNIDSAKQRAVIAEQMGLK